MVPPGGRGLYGPGLAPLGLDSARLIVVRRRGRDLTARLAALIGVGGRVQREGEVIHVLAEEVFDLTPLIARLGAEHHPHAPGAVV